MDQTSNEIPRLLASMADDVRSGTIDSLTTIQFDKVNGYLVQREREYRLSVAELADNATNQEKYIWMVNRYRNVLRHELSLSHNGTEKIQTWITNRFCYFTGLIDSLRGVA